MNVCILGTGLTSLTLAKALVNLGINVDLVSNEKKKKRQKNNWYFKVKYRFFLIQNYLILKN